MAEYSNTASNTGAFLGAISVEEVLGGAAGKVGGAIVQPAIWVATGASPDAVDYGLYAVGLTGIFGAVAAGATGIVKGLVEDHTEQQMISIRAAEPAKYRPFLLPTTEYSGWSGMYINAMTIASKGGTAWMHKNGLWVYIVDAKGRLVPDYKPSSYKKLFQPALPLKQSADGGYAWEMK